MKENNLSLSEDDISHLRDEYDLLTFPHDYDLIYENQVPIAGIIIVEGVVEMIKRSKVLGCIYSGNILGLSELLENRPIKFRCRIKANSKIIVLGKSELIKLSKKKPLF